MLAHSANLAPRVCILRLKMKQNVTFFHTVGEIKHALQIVRTGLPGSTLRLTALIAAKYKSSMLLLPFVMEFWRIKHTLWSQLLHYTEIQSFAVLKRYTWGINECKLKQTHSHWKEINVIDLPEGWLLFTLNMLHPACQNAPLKHPAAQAPNTWDVLWAEQRSRRAFGFYYIIWILLHNVNKEEKSNKTTSCRAFTRGGSLTNFKTTAQISLYLFKETFAWLIR